MSTGDVRDRLSRTQALGGQAPLVESAARIFDFVQFLLDDDEHLTPTGNLNGAGRTKLRARIAELVDAGDAPDATPDAAPDAMLEATPGTPTDAP